MKTSRRGGFTLVELMAVASLIALAASGTAILMLRGAKSMAVDQAANRLLLTAKSARVAAIQTGRPQQLVLDQPNRRFFLTTEPTEDEAAALEEGAVPMSQLTTLPEGVTFERIGVMGVTEESQNQVAFRPNGSAQTAVIQIGNGTNHMTVTVLEATGRVKLQEGIAETISQDWIDLDEYEQTSL